MTVVLNDSTPQGGPEGGSAPLLDELALIVEPRKAWLDEAEDEEILISDGERPGRA